MKKNKVFLFALTAMTGFTLAACSANTQSTTSKESTTTSETKVDLNTLDLPQLETTVKDNESVVEIETTAGNIQVKLFPAIAPKAVENFVTHAKEGYYDGTPFHRVIEGFMIQGGDPDGNGTGGESIWGKGFKVELSNQLYHIRGALSMARSSALDSQGSQFFIVQNNEDASKNLAIQFTPEKIIEAYKNGGVPSLDGNYTVFGQVIEGMDVVDKIAQAKVEASEQGEASKPVESVTITATKVLQEAKE